MQFLLLRSVAMSAFAGIFCTLCGLVFCSLASTINLPTNWRDFIDPEILAKGNDDSLYDSDLLEGDITGLEALQVAHGAANSIDKADSFWPNNTIPYTFTKKRFATLTTREIRIVLESMDVISHLTGNCVRFVERTDEEDYINFQKGLQCMSNIGRTGGKQTVTYATGCLKNHGDVQHELMHTMGFFHEHSRADRDQYVTIIWDNIDESDKEQFAKHESGNTFGIPYDYESIMHYKYNAFAKDSSLPTIVPKIKRSKIGQNVNLSPFDLARIHRRFRCAIAAASTFLRGHGSILLEGGPKKSTGATKLPETTKEPESQETTTELSETTNAPEQFSETTPELSETTNAPEQFSETTPELPETTNAPEELPKTTELSEITNAAEVLPETTNMPELQLETTSVPEVPKADDADEPFPTFSNIPLGSDECQAQSTTNCKPDFSFFNIDLKTCKYRGLVIKCTSIPPSASEIAGITASMSQPPLRPIELFIADGPVLTPKNFGLIQKQVVIFYLTKCENSRSLGRLPKLRFTNLLELSLSECSDLDIRKDDLRFSRKLRILTLGSGFYPSTIRTLEKDTFTNLPDLRLISLEYQSELYHGQRDHIIRLHCDCAYAWYRRWWQDNTELLREANSGDIYLLSGSFMNNLYRRKDVYLPVDCSSPPSGLSGIRFEQEEYSVNEPDCP